ncbi:MAG TPA: hypothetical protein VN939_01900 [Chthoniobacterales bacterium]|nr:hypothetical protein [Chthoniobacterales bacterium]
MSFNRTAMPIEKLIGLGLDNNTLQIAGDCGRLHQTRAAQLRSLLVTSEN